MRVDKCDACGTITPSGEDAHWFLLSRFTGEWHESRDAHGTYRFAERRSLSLCSPECVHAMAEVEALGESISS